MKALLLLSLLPALSYGATQTNFAHEWGNRTGAAAIQDASAEEIIAATASVATSGAATAPEERDIYVAIRHDGLAGSGTAKDPFDGSTQPKFDAILANLMTVDTTIHTNVHLAAGIYTVTPVRQVATTANPAGYVWNLPGNLSILGAGENLTTVRAGIVDTPNATYLVLFHLGHVGGVFYKNLTIDCNAQNQTAAHVTIDGIVFINFYGVPTQSAAEYVHVINGGTAPGQTPNGEWFGIGIHDATASGVAIASHCRIDHYQGNAGCTALSADSLIANNSVTLNKNDCYNLTGTGSGTGGYQNAYSPSREVEHNVCHNCTFGIYSDVDDEDNYTIENNWFDALYQDVCLIPANRTVSNIVIRNNVFVDAIGQAVTLGANQTTSVTGVSITNNKFVMNYQHNTVKPVFSFYSASGVEISDNLFNTTAGGVGYYIGASINNSDAGSFTWKNNHYGSGAVLPPVAGMSN